MEGVTVTSPKGQARWKKLGGPSRKFPTKSGEGQVYCFVIIISPFLPHKICSSQDMVEAVQTPPFCSSFPQTKAALAKPGFFSASLSFPLPVSFPHPLHTSKDSVLFWALCLPTGDSHSTTLEFQNDDLKSFGLEAPLLPCLPPQMCLFLIFVFIGTRLQYTIITFIADLQPLGNMQLPFPNSTDGSWKRVPSAGYQSGQQESGCGAASLGALQGLGSRRSQGT